MRGLSPIHYVESDRVPKRMEPEAKIVFDVHDFLDPLSIILLVLVYGVHKILCLRFYNIPDCGLCLFSLVVSCHTRQVEHQRGSRTGIVQKNH